MASSLDNQRSSKAATSGNNSVTLNYPLDQPVNRDLGSGNDTVTANARDGESQVRLTVTSSEVGNGKARDSDTMANQDGGLAVRLQEETTFGTLRGPISRVDDEGIVFKSSTNTTFDVRDLVSGVERGDQFDVVRLGTKGADSLIGSVKGNAYYLNGGMGNDRIVGGLENDVLVGGAGNDVLSDRAGNDTFIGGTGNDTINGGIGDDIAIFNVTTDGSDKVDLGEGRDIVNVAAAKPGEVRLTFTSSEVGNDSARDSKTLANQDGGLAVRLQSEDGSDGLSGAVSRYDDEGIRFVSTTPGVKFDIRDLVSGVQRGNQFSVAELGTKGNDVILGGVVNGDSFYFNAGMGDDSVTGGFKNDFLVGGGGNDVLTGRAGNDSFIGGAGDDTIIGGVGDDTAIFAVATDGSDTVDLGQGLDTVNVNAPITASQVRLTFTSSEVGNVNASDSRTMANQDGGLAVRLQAEDGAGGLSGLTSRFDDEGVSFASTTPGVTFDVRDLVSGVQRGDQFGIVRLGTNGDDTFNDAGKTSAVYINAGMGNDMVTGGSGNDFLVGGLGNDTLSGLGGNDAFIGGGGSDVFVFEVATGNDTINDFVSGTDKIDLRSFKIGLDNITTTTVGANTLLNVDANRDGAADFNITLLNVAKPVESDYLLA